eukprot:4852661-Pyramimonas_sp.AAC.1
MEAFGKQLDEFRNALAGVGTDAIRTDLESKYAALRGQFDALFSHSPAPTSPPCQAGPVIMEVGEADMADAVDGVTGLDAEKI